MIQARFPLLFFLLLNDIPGLRCFQYRISRVSGGDLDQFYGSFPVHKTTTTIDNHQVAALEQELSVVKENRL